MTLELCIVGSLASELEVMARKADVEPNDLLEKVVRQFLSRQNVLHSEGEDRRTFLRMSVRIPAMVYFEDRRGEIRYQSAIISDVSSDGLKILCTGKKPCGGAVRESVLGAHFEIIFAYSDDMTPMRFKCEAVRVEISDEEMEVGARILTSSPEGLKAYRKLLDDLGLVDGVE